LVLLFSFEVPLEKNYQKKVAAKKSINKEGALCVFSFLLCDGGL
jgi:hypothetical protein